MIILMVKENLYLQMAIFTMVNGKIIYLQVKDSIQIRNLFGDMKEIGMKEHSMVGESRFFKMVLIMKEILIKG
jgi:hypothetical protein